MNLNTITTAPGAAIGSEYDLLPAKRLIAQAGERQPTPAIDDDERAMIHRITDLAIAVTAAGRYIADVDFHGHAGQFALTTLPVGQDYGESGQYRRVVHMDQLDGPLFDLRKGLDGLCHMITHLEALLAQGPADHQEASS